ncbi:MAG: Holliday junction resolvase RuvX [Zetaproteobacteria bacterium]|nr:MAG: Holliday junction resolvase RuvX [Zetaproteobacteria bacterium]
MTAASCSTTEDLPAGGDGLALPLLALDIGMRRIGVAVSDRRGLVARGIACLARRDKQWPLRLKRVIDEYGVRGIVAGLPRNMDGSEGEQAKDARAAVAELQRVISLPIVFQDERLSTWSAKERLFAQGLSEKRVRKKLDQTAAAIILEDFLHAHPELRP